MQPLKLCRRWTTDSTEAERQNRHWCRAQQRRFSADSCAYERQMSSWCKIPFYCFLAQDIVHCVICRYLRVILFCRVWPQFSWFFLFWRERVHLSLKILMGLSPIEHLSVLLIFILDVHSLAARQHLQFWFSSGRQASIRRWNFLLELLPQKKMIFQLSILCLIVQMWLVCFMKVKNL